MTIRTYNRETASYIVSKRSEIEISDIEWNFAPSVIPHTLSVFHHEIRPVTHQLFVWGCLWNNGQFNYIVYQYIRIFIHVHISC